MRDYFRQIVARKNQNNNKSFTCCSQNLKKTRKKMDQDEMQESVDDMKDEEMEAEDSSDEEDTSDDGDEVDDDEDVKAEQHDEEEATIPTAYIPGQQELADGEELVMDNQAYIIYHQASLGPPCLSFDLIPDDLGADRADSYPLSLYGVAGTQATKMAANSVIVFKMDNLHPIKRKVKDKDSDDDESEDEEEEENDDPEKQPKLKVAALKHSGCINRIRFKTIGDISLAAAWSEAGSVGIWSLDACLQRVHQPGGSSDKDPRESTSPLFNFRGHKSEGFALNWSPMSPGVLATGDCQKAIHIWKPTQDSWAVEPRPLVGHTASVEDILWSPTEANVLASCSVDKSIRIWDCRAKPDKANMLTVEAAHDSDVNVIDWNRNEPFLASGGDDGALKIWDLRSIDKGQPVAVFNHHTQPVTSVEWHPKDSTVLASSGADNQIALWDLAIEKDSEEIMKEQGLKDEELKDVPPQLLFIHQGMQDVKEVHWHPQIPGLLVSTSQTGFDVFRTISV